VGDCIACATAIKYAVNEFVLKVYTATDFMSDSLVYYASANGSLASFLDWALGSCAENHSFEPTPQDIIKVQESDLFLMKRNESLSLISPSLFSAPVWQLP